MASMVVSSLPPETCSRNGVVIATTFFGCFPRSASVDLDEIPSVSRGSTGGRLAGQSRTDTTGCLGRNLAWAWGRWAIQILGVEDCPDKPEEQRSETGGQFAAPQLSNQPFRK